MAVLTRPALPWSAVNTAPTLDGPAPSPRTGREPDVIAALADLRRARRRNRLRTVHWIDALYRVYLTGLATFSAVIVTSGLFPDQELSDDAVQRALDVGPAWFGVAVAVLIAVGLRSGSRGGPLTLEAATVHHELLAPVDRAAALRTPAWKQLRFLVFTASIVGAILGNLASHRLPVDPLPAAAATALATSLGVAIAVGAAQFAGGRSIPRAAANLAGAALIGWSLADAFGAWATSPLTLLGGVAFWPLDVAPVTFAAPLLAAAAVAAGMGNLGGLSLEAARRRAGLVSQLRFAVTLQDVRTVVLLRRQLSQEKPRTRPWVRLGRRSRVPPVWRRDLQGYLRFPLVRFARMALLGAVAGAALGGMWRGTAPLFVVAGLALFVAAYDTVEPLAQEVDHPTRWDGLHGDPGRLLVMHLPPAVIAMALVCGMAALTALAFVPATVVTELFVVVFLPVAGAAVVGAAVSTALSGADLSKLNALGSDMMGMIMVLRMVVPPALTIGALAPLLAAGHDPSAIDAARVSNLMTWPLFAMVGGIMYLRFRSPSNT